MKKLKPQSVKKFNCLNCKELLVKVYPYGVIYTNPPVEIKVGCAKCAKPK